MPKAKKSRAPKMTEHEMSIEDAISSAMSEIQSLADEMREAFDNTPESLQGSAAGQAREEAADNLENISEPDVPTELQGSGFVVKWSTKTLSPSAMRKQSRSDRRYEAVETLCAVVSHLEKISEDKELSKEVREAAENFVDDVQSVIDDAEAVDFPGMYG